jgi:hypothetical protein
MDVIPDVWERSFLMTRHWYIVTSAIEIQLIQCGCWQISKREKTSTRVKYAIFFGISGLMYPIPTLKQKKYQVLFYYFWTAILIQYAKRDPKAKVCEINLLPDNVQPQVVQRCIDEQTVVTLINPPYSPQYASDMLFLFFYWLCTVVILISLYTWCGGCCIPVSTPYTKESVPQRTCAMDTSSEKVCYCEGIVFWWNVICLLLFHMGNITFWTPLVHIYDTYSDLFE